MRNANCQYTKRLQKKQEDIKKKSSQDRLATVSIEMCEKHEVWNEESVSKVIKVTLSTAFNKHTHFIYLTFDRFLEAG